MSPVKEVLISLTSSSPADPPGKKRTRSALKALNINGGSPEKAVDRADKPVRKASRASVSSVKSNKENIVEETDETVDLEALETHDGMVLDA